MATSKQIAAAKQNVRKAQQSAGKQRTLAALPDAVRRDLGRQGARGRSRGGASGHRLEDRNRTQLYELAQRKQIAGRSKMGKWELIDAIRKSS
jgi:phage gp16-like protein